MRYCKHCVIPSSRPNISVGTDGQDCNCVFGQKQKEIDWVGRKSAFGIIAEEVKALKRPYDCLIPVSGGKDSTWQVIKALEYGLKPLAVTWKTPVRNELGRKNLENLVNLGVDHIDFSVNPLVEKKFTLKAFVKYGTPAIPMHMAIHAVALRFASMYQIPMILWGENSAEEYGGDVQLKGCRLTYDWLMKYGCTNGTVAEDWVDSELSPRDLEPYKWPLERIQDGSLKAVFLGHFFPWDPIETFEIARSNGFEGAETPKTGIYNFADVDDYFLIAIHHWMKWYKFGFTRTWDNLSVEIRAGRISRSEAVDILKTNGDERPAEEIKMFCEYVGISEDQFENIANQHRNLNIWDLSNDGSWRIKNFLIEDWVW